MFAADWDNDEIWFFTSVAGEDQPPKPADLRLVFVKICTLAENSMI